MSIRARREVKTRIQTARRLRLFLDYDGTLAGFAATPECVEPDPQVIALLNRLVEDPRMHVSVISGRRLGHVEKLLPVPGLLLAGTYGIELRLPHGERVDRVVYDQVRPLLEEIKLRWARLLADREGFFLEDKGWALAIHARHAAEAEAEEVLDRARGLIGVAVSSDLFRVLGGYKFLEVGPALAHKGKTVGYLLDRYPCSGALPLYVGDDDKDEEAFGVIQRHGGIAIRVCEEPCDTCADGRLTSPQNVRRWLRSLLV